MRILKMLWQGFSLEQDRLKYEIERHELEQERLKVTSEMLATSQHALMIEKERLNLQLENQHRLISLHELLSEVSIENGSRIDNILRGVQKIINHLEIPELSEVARFEHDRQLQLRKELYGWYRQADKLKLIESTGSATVADLLRLEDVENQIQILLAELESTNG